MGAARAAARYRSVSNGYRPWDGIQELLLLLLLPLLLLLLLLHLLLLQLLLAADRCLQLLLLLAADRCLQLLLLLLLAADCCLQLVQLLLLAVDCRLLDAGWRRSPWKDGGGGAADDHWRSHRHHWQRWRSCYGRLRQQARERVHTGRLHAWRARRQGCP